MDNQKLEELTGILHDGLCDLTVVIAGRTYALGGIIQHHVLKNITEAVVAQHEAVIYELAQEIHEIYLGQDSLIVESKQEIIDYAWKNVRSK